MKEKEEKVSKNPLKKTFPGTFPDHNIGFTVDLGKTLSH
jgi:hypothetical protein